MTDARETPPPALTKWLRAWEAGDAEAGERLAEATYRELRKLAKGRLARERRGPLDTTELVHEAYLRVAGRGTDWSHRAHFFGTAARAMRQVLVDLARRRKTVKHGVELVTLVEERAPGRRGMNHPVDVLALDRALERLAGFDERKAHLVELRFFGGLSIAETAAALDVSVSTVERDLRAARAWLAAELAGDADVSGSARRD